jgi:ankyrin repeat protein
MLASVEGNCSPQNGCQETPLHTAIIASQSEMAIMLVEAGANLSLRDNLERTPLDLAQELEQAEVVAAIQRALNDGPEGSQGTPEDDKAMGRPLIDEMLKSFGD